ncbi:MAG: hypothetical protein U0797_13290 [Gemmataceae bacterium]
MDVRILDLDGGVAAQPSLKARASSVVPLRNWGPRLRLACGWRAFARFERDLDRVIPTRPALTFLGSGDFHHLSLALLRRLTRPFNLLVIDNHPDWMRGVPVLHCGTWLYHAARLPAVRRVFHVGGDVDFDNAYRWLAPWSMLRSGQITVLSAVRMFRGRGWARVPHARLRPISTQPVAPSRIVGLVASWREELASLPLYITLDRDVLRAQEAAVNWDSGHLVTEEVLTLLDAFVSFSGGVVGADVVGDWSPVRVQGSLRRVLHAVEHPRLEVGAEEAQRRNERLNLALVEMLAGPTKSDLAKDADQHPEDAGVGVGIDDDRLHRPVARL